MRILSEVNSLRVPLLLTVCLLISTVIAVNILTGYTIVPWALYPPFADLVYITSAVDCVRAGNDPVVANGFDPWFRPFNYPAVWLYVFDFFDLTKKTTNLLGIMLSFSYSLAAIFLLKLKKAIFFPFLLALILSPPILLCLERGNTDIIIFLLVVFSFYYLRIISLISDPVKFHVSYILLIIAAILKLYPIFLLPLLFFERISKKNLFFAITYCAIILIGYFTVTYNKIQHISLNTPRPEDALSFGRNVGLHFLFNTGSLQIASAILFGLVILSAYMVSLYFKHKLGRLIPVNYTMKNNIIIFLAGGLLYTGTFFIGNHYDYRLIFIILMVPYLFDIINQTHNRTITIVTFCLFFPLLYGAFISHFVKIFVIFKILASWGLCFFLFLIMFHLFHNRKRFVNNMTVNAQ